MYLQKKFLRNSVAEMSIATESNNSGGGHRIEGLDFAQRDVACVSSAYESSELHAFDRGTLDGGSMSASSTSSIGKNSFEALGSGSASDGEEVQSEFKGGPLDSLESLEEVLPVKKSISKFYNGKSKSFTSLFDAASCSSIEEIIKPENAYTRKRTNLLAFNNLWDKNRNCTLRSHNSGMLKRPTNSRSMLVLAANMNCSESNSGETSNSNSPSPGFCLPPLPPHARRALNGELSSSPPVDKFASRSFSLSDLQGASAAEAAIPSITGLWSNNSDK